MSEARCPVCGVALAIVTEAEGEADPLTPVVRRLEAEQYGSPEPLPEIVTWGSARSARLADDERRHHGEL